MAGTENAIALVNNAVIRVIIFFMYVLLVSN